jgi:hypothetical protein
MIRFLAAPLAVLLVVASAFGQAAGRGGAASVSALAFGARLPVRADERNGAPRAQEWLP